MSLCVNCYKPVASDEDWETTPEGESDRLCWRQDTECVYPNAQAREILALRQENQKLTLRIEELEAKLLV